MPPVSTTAAGAPAATLSAYESLAPFYDEFTSDSKYEPVIDALETWARAQGLRGKQMLDAACGTGKSFELFLGRGYRITACDASPAMLAEARKRAGGEVTLAVADMRSLPWESEFDLVTCVDDAINYLLTEADLRAAVASMSRALRPDGIAVFDANTLHAYRTCWADSFEMVVGDTTFRWHGRCAPDAPPGAVATATLTVEHPGGVSESHHVERHWRVDELRQACLAAGFGHVVFRGLAEGPSLEGEPDEERHPKMVCLAARPKSEQGGRCGVVTKFK